MLGRSFSIADSFCSWKTHGVIARLVYVHFLTERDANQAFLAFERKRSADMLNTVKARTQFWLAKADFAERLIGFFD
jgi:hypothetical protein